MKIMLRKPVLSISSETHTRSKKGVAATSSSSSSSGRDGRTAVSSDPHLVKAVGGRASDVSISMTNRTMDDSASTRLMSDGSFLELSHNHLRCSVSGGGGGGGPEEDCRDVDGCDGTTPIRFPPVAGTNSTNSAHFSDDSGSKELLKVLLMEEEEEVAGDPVTTAKISSSDATGTIPNGPESTDDDTEEDVTGSTDEIGMISKEVEKTTTDNTEDVVVSSDERDTAFWEAAVANLASIINMPDKSAVRFGTLEIHEHVIDLGGAVPSCGPPITLEWEAQSHFSVPVEDYEALRPSAPRKGHELLRTKKQRIDLLLNLGYTLREITRSSQDCERIRIERAKSSKQWSVWKWLCARKMSFSSTIQKNTSL